MFFKLRILFYLLFLFWRGNLINQSMKGGTKMFFKDLPKGKKFKIVGTLKKNSEIYIKQYPEGEEANRVAYNAMVEKTGNKVIVLPDTQVAIIG